MRRFRDESCRLEGVACPTVQTLRAQYDAFAEMPIVHGPDGANIFDSRAYAALHAADMLATANKH